MSDLVPSTGGLPDEKYARDLLRRLPRGFRIAYAVHPGDGFNQKPRRVGRHPYVFDAVGAVVRCPDGSPVTVASTPGGHNTLRKDLGKLRRAGVPVR